MEQIQDKRERFRSQLFEAALNQSLDQERIQELEHNFLKHCRSLIEEDLSPESDLLKEKRHSMLEQQEEKSNRGTFLYFRRRWGILAACICMAFGLGFLLSPYFFDVFGSNAGNKKQEVTAGLRGIYASEGAGYEKDGDTINLKGGWFFLNQDQALVYLGNQRVEQFSGRALAFVGKDFSVKKRDEEFLGKLQEQGIILNKEKTMFNEVKRWFVKGSLALCLVSGSALVNGELVVAQEREEEKSSEESVFFEPESQESLQKKFEALKQEFKDNETMEQTFSIFAFRKTEEGNHLLVEKQEKLKVFYFQRQSSGDKAYVGVQGGEIVAYEKQNGKIENIVIDENSREFLIRGNFRVITKREIYNNDSGTLQTSAWESYTLQDRITNGDFDTRLHTDVSGEHADDDKCLVIAKSHLVGACREWDYKGALEHQAFYNSDGKKVGIEQSWHRGKLRLEIHYNAQGEKEGVERRWNFDGVLEYEVHWQANQKHGLEQQLTGSFPHEISWKYGQKEGLFREWYDGRIEKEVNYSQDRRHGKAISYDYKTDYNRNEIVITVVEEEWQRGFKHGKSRTTQRIMQDGNSQEILKEIVVEEKYFQEGFLHGTWTKWDEAGNVIFEKEYENGLLVPEK